MSRLACDVMVVGGELCGLAAAALIAQHVGEQRVVVVDQDDANAGLPLGDRLAPAAPSLFRLAGPPPNGERISSPPQLQSPVIRLLDELGIKQDARRILGDTGGLGLIDDPDIRMVVPVDADARTRELTRVFGAEVGERAASRLLELHGDSRVPLIAEAAALHHDGFFASRRQRLRVKALGPAGALDTTDGPSARLADLPLAVALEQLVPFVQSRTQASPLGIAGLLAGLQLQAGGYTSARGGLGPRAAFAELLCDVIRRHRGDVVRARVVGVDSDGTSVTTVQTSNGHTYLPRVVVDATASRELSAHLPPGRRRNKLAEAEKRVQPAGDAAAVRWLVPVGALPRGMPPLGLVLRPPSEESSAVLVGLYAGAPLADATKAQGADDAAVALVAGAVCGPGKAQHAAALAERVLDELVPFAREQALARDVVLGGPAQAVLQQWVVVESEHPLLGRRPQTPFKNLLRGGRDLAPGLGVEGELTAARAVVGRAEELLGIHRKGVLP